MPIGSKPKSAAPRTKAKSNALGYARRKSLGRAKPSSSADVDSHGRKGKGKRNARKERRNEEMLLDPDEALNFPGPVGGEEEKEKRVRLIGEGEDGLGSDDDGDEEIDSDDAFGESDREGYAGFYSEKKAAKKRNVKLANADAEVDLNEEDSDSDVDVDMDGEEGSGEEGSASEFVDLLDIIDGRGEAWNSDDDDNAPAPDDQKEDPLTTSQNRKWTFDEPIDEISASEDDDEKAQPDSLTSFIDSLPTSSFKRPAPAPSSSEPHSTKKRRVQIQQEQTEAGEENPFRAVATAGVQKVNLDDLLVNTDADTGLEKSVEMLGKAVKRQGVRGKGRVDVLSVPLDLRTQNKLEREAAYEATKGEVTEHWAGSMKMLLDAEHISFPLQPQAESKTSSLELAAKFKPTTPLESSIASLLRKANMGTEGDMANAEEHMLKRQLERNEVTREEIAQRRAELRYMRELALRADKKKARMNKIKSKVYRRLRRKEKAKIDGVGAGGEGDGGQEEEEAKKIERAKVRAGVKVRRRREVGRGGVDDDVDGESGDEDEETSKLDREERLAKLIRGEGDDSDEEEEEEEGWDAKAALNALKMNGEEAAEEKGVFGMKFMREGLKRREREVDEEVDAVVAEIDDADEGKEGREGGREGDVDVSRSAGGGRMVFRPGQMSARGDVAAVHVQSRDTDGEHDGPSSTTTTTTATKANSRPLSSASSSKAAQDEANPWLAREAGSADPVKKKKNEVVMSKELARGDREKGAGYKLGKRLAREVHGDGGEGGDREEKMDVDVDITHEEEESDDEQELQENSFAQNRKEARKFEQRELVALAFAGDGVVERNFLGVKRREEEEDRPREVDGRLPGWGAWGGAGSGVGVKGTGAKGKEGKGKEGKGKKYVRYVPGVKPEQRKDAGRKHLIISEKSDKKSTKYTLADLPYPYTSRAQYERAMEHPVGKEWNSQVGFARGTMPRVVVKPGTVIEPIRYRAK